MTISLTPQDLDDIIAGRETVSEPIRDDYRLGHIARSAYLIRVHQGFYTPTDYDALEKQERAHWQAVGEKVRDAVCPPDHIVVPKTEHDTLMALLLDIDAEFVPAGPQTVYFHELMGRLTVIDATYRAALTPEPTNGE